MVGGSGLRIILVATDPNAAARAAEDAALAKAPAVRGIVVLGGDFGPNQRLIAYNPADGAERWWVAGLPPCGKSTPVIGGGMVFFAASDIIMDVEAEKRNPERAAQLYANNASRVMAVRPGGKEAVNETHVAWSEHKGTPGVPSPLY